MAGVVEESVKVVTGVVDTYKNNPLTLAIIIMNIGLMLLLFYYMNRITTRTEITLKELFVSQDKLYSQWSTVIKDTNSLTEKAMHCILPSDALQLLQAPARPYGSESAPQRPAPPAPLPQNDHPRYRPQQKSPVFKEIDVPFFEPMKLPAETEQK